MMNDRFVGNWIEAMCARELICLTANINEGHVSSRLCFLANIVCQTQRTLRSDPTAQRFIGDEDATQKLIRDYREPFRLPKEV